MLTSKAYKKCVSEFFLCKLIILNAKNSKVHQILTEKKTQFSLLRGKTCIFVLNAYQIILYNTF